MIDVDLDTPKPSTTVRVARKKAPQQGSRQSRAGWFVKITMGFLCLIWVIPTFGLLVTSFRDPEAANTSGWWTVFASPLKATQWTLQNYSSVLFEGQTPMGISFVNSLAVALPATIIPIMIAAFAAYAFTVHGVPRPRHAVHRRCRALVVPNQIALVPCSSATTTSE